MSLSSCYSVLRNEEITAQRNEPKNRKRHRFPRSLSPGNHGTTEITGNSTLEKKKNAADEGGSEGEEGE